MKPHYLEWGRSAAQRRTSLLTTEFTASPQRYSRLAPLG